MINRPGTKPSSGKKKSSFIYKERSASSVKERAEQSGGRYDSVFRTGLDVFRAKQGDNAIRILPPTWDDHEHYGYDIYVHKYIGPNKGTYLCPAKMKNKNCPICKAADEARNGGEEDEARALSATKQVVAWIIDRNADNPTPMIYPMSWSIDRDIAALCQNKKTGNVLLIDHPDEGYDVSFKRVGQGLKTKYIAWAIDRDTSPISEDTSEQQEILDFITETAIPETLVYKEIDYLKKMLEGGEDEKDEELDEDEETDKKIKRRKPRDEDEEDEEEEKKPVKKKKPAKDEDEEEDPPFDEDEEEEKPVKKKKPTADEDEDEEEEEKPKRRASRRDEEDEEEEEEEEKPAKKKKPAPDEDEEEEEEEKPVKKKPSRRDEDEDEEEEEEEEPRRKLKPRR